MNNERRSIFEQLRQNSVALISIAIAISSLSYNTWRNEKTEDNRNQRFAAFEILLKLSELRQVVFYHHYDNDKIDKGNPRTGWSYVLTVQDLSRILPSPLQDKADTLLTIWNDNWEELGEQDNTVNLVMDGIDEMRGETLQLLDSLE